MWAPANPKIREREVLAAMLEVDTGLVADGKGIVLISDKGFASRPFEKDLAEQGIELLRPSRKREKQRYGEPMLKKVRQLIESVNDTLKGSRCQKASSPFLVDASLGLGEDALADESAHAASVVFTEASSAGRHRRPSRRVRVTGPGSGADRR